MLRTAARVRGLVVIGMIKTVVPLASDRRHRRQCKYYPHCRWWVVTWSLVPEQPWMNVDSVGAMGTLVDIKDMPGMQDILNNIEGINSFTYPK